MKLIIITRPEYFEGETDLVNALFAEGMPRLHLRKPKASQQEMADWIGQVEPAFRSRIVLHDHHDLTREFHLGGIHLNSRHPEPPDWLTDCPWLTVSRSCHSLAEVQQYLVTQSTSGMPIYDYLFLSPIFDSISKEGYGATFTQTELTAAREDGLLSDRVFALGGISLDRLPTVRNLGFAGAAILGDLWLHKPATTSALIERLHAYSHV